MRCLYDVLSVPRDADESTIRKAYRKGALAWHPDKNQGNLEEADARFKELQNAYEVLSDQQEKAWYDSHRDQILRAGRHQAGQDGGHEGQSAAPEDLSLYQYFSSSCYSSFNDGPKGFYTVYGKVFKDLGAQEASAQEGVRNKPGHVAPGFGKGDSPWSEVSTFYQYWLYFVSDRSFTWADAYNPASAPNRKVRRLMEDDNNKRRKAARREFQENVRALVAFVRKRDVRVIAWTEHEDRKKAEREAAEKRRKEEEGAERMRRALEYEEPEWIREADADSHSSEGAALIEDELYCVACDKFFKSDKAIENHNRSKKHFQNAEILRAALAEEEAEADQMAAEHDTQSVETHSLASSESQAASAASPDAHTAKQPHVRDPAHVVHLDEDTDHAESASTAESTGSDFAEPAHDSGSDDASESSVESLDEDAILQRMVQAHMQLGKGRKQKRSPSKGGPPEDSHGGDSSTSDQSPTDESARANGRLQPDVHDGAHLEDADSYSHQTEMTTSNTALPTLSPSLQETQASAQDTTANDKHAHSKQGIAVGDRHHPNSSTAALEGKSTGGSASKQSVTELARRPNESTGKKESAPKKGSKSRNAKNKGGKGDPESDALTCQVCSETFDTRNLLFKHIKEQAHARMVTE